MEGYLKRIQINKMNNSERRDIPVIYSLRAIAAISVCLCHFIEHPYFHNPELINVFFIGKYGVEMFFIISGFIIPWSMYQRGYVFKSFFTFLFKRLVRLEPPYIASIIITLVMLFLRHKLLIHTTADTPSYTQIALHFGYLIPFFKNYHWLQLMY
jgi:peptidoglycan/LPS O-acetylase OafA/YrhL